MKRDIDRDRATMLWARQHKKGRLHKAAPLVPRPSLEKQHSRAITMGIKKCYGS